MKYELDSSHQNVFGRNCRSHKSTEKINHKKRKDYSVNLLKHLCFQSNYANMVVFYADPLKNVQ